MTILEARGVFKEYAQPGGSVLALCDVGIAVAERELVVVTGESGSGKSTLLALLGALDLPSRGAIRLLGEPLESAGPARLAELRRRHIGFVFQDFHLVRHLNALENVRLPLFFEGGNHLRDEAVHLLERVGLRARLHHRPDALSRGEMQRVAVARALIHRPRVLLADEPTANLDRRNADAIWGLFRELNRDGLTIVAATHNAEQARDAARLIRLKEGRVVSDEAR